MHRLRWLLLVAAVAAMGWGTAVSAQEPNVDPAFSNEIITTLGYPEVEIAVGPDGVEAPSTLEAGIYLVTLAVSEPYVGYMNFMQPPAGLSEDEATKLALDAARDDLVQPGWVYAGGTNTPGSGETASFLIDLRPGDYQIAASFYTMGDGEGEVLNLAPLAVTEPAASATPNAAATPAAEPPAAVTLEETDNLQYIVSPEPVPAGPQIWKITNTGTMHAHHVVMVRVPDGSTKQQIISEFNGLMAGTPPAGDAVMSQSVWVGYAALQSGGWTTWAEFDLKPATYAVICYIFNPETGRPHAADGMVTVFSVE
jgi:hypothetical protein